MKIAFCCTASQDYLEKYDRCYGSHQAYCEKFNIDYKLDNEPLKEGQTRAEWYWRKLSSTLPYFECYDYVVVIDIDIEITNKTPDIRSIIDDNSIFYANGISKRPNSGFLIIKTDEIGKKFIKEVLNSRNTKVGKGFGAPGENGHVIKYLHFNPEKSKEISSLWNNTDPNKINEAYLLHYTNKLSSYYDNRSI
jgi:hypothetical protein